MTRGLSSTTDSPTAPRSFVGWHSRIRAGMVGRALSPQQRDRRAANARRLGPWTYVAVVLGFIAAIQYLYFQRGLIPGDAFQYLAAGERLNAGHPLYALSPGDRPADIHPEYWGIPLVSPPFIAVVWRPLALLGDAAPYVWWAAQVAALTTSVAMLLRRHPMLTATALLVLGIPFVYEFAVGNVNSFILLGLLVVWRTYASGRTALTGGLATVLAAVKVTPVMAVWWAVLTGRRRALLGSFAAVALALSVSLAGAGLENHLAYVNALAAGQVRFSPLSLGGTLVYVGVPETAAQAVVAGIVLGLLIAIWSLRARPDRAFQVAVVAMIAASPAVSINWFILLLALLAPLAWPLPRGQAVMPGP